MYGFLLSTTALCGTDFLRSCSIFTATLQAYNAIFLKLQQVYSVAFEVLLLDLGVLAFALLF